ncbi:uncharacterized protein LY79DRAFT_559294 [Colletotrichum navitas]|uniref:Uncharacterized protein n=1 Tax=Colletotrichum navitas TaxID=681940 RepID=A0AAD8PUV8_9PEZI|nr:uncharacterized protein LY79DRAFT_559294 [Colletotrichum navitas]KAK1585137.1 hypothetical protein LY79DRAFT_559294 [Colletotrichum navitas]
MNQVPVLATPSSPSTELGQPCPTSRHHHPLTLLIVHYPVVGSVGTLGTCGGLPVYIVTLLLAVSSTRFRWLSPLANLQPRCQRACGLAYSWRSWALGPPSDLWALRQASSELSSTQSPIISPLALFFWTDPLACLSGFSVCVFVREREKEGGGEGQGETKRRRLPARNRDIYLPLLLLVRVVVKLR